MDEIFVQVQRLCLTIISLLSATPRSVPVFFDHDPLLIHQTGRSTLVDLQTQRLIDANPNAVSAIHIVYKLESKLTPLPLPC
jgi:hypothetical protein